MSYVSVGTTLADRVRGLAVPTRKSSWAPKPIYAAPAKASGAPLPASVLAVNSLVGGARLATSSLATSTLSSGVPSIMTAGSPGVSSGGSVFKGGGGSIESGVEFQEPSVGEQIDRNASKPVPWIALAIGAGVLYFVFKK